VTDTAQHEPPSRREQILDAAAELFAARGFHGVGIDDIGAAVGISGPALYRHFRSKDAMLGEMLTAISEHLHSGGRMQASSPPDGLGALGALIRFHIDFALDHPALITVQERNLANLTESDRRRVRSEQRSYVEVWVRAIRAHAPGISQHRARATAHATLGLINSTPHSRYLGREEMAELLTTMAHSAVTAADPRFPPSGSDTTVG
jgi:AcrR family transcriptional regulator